MKTNENQSPAPTSDTASNDTALSGYSASPALTRQVNQAPVRPAAPTSFFSNNDIVFTGNIPGVFAEETIRANAFSMANRHFHESFELYFLLEGERFYFIDQDTYHVRAGTAVLIDRNQIHKTSMAGTKLLHHRFLLQIDPVLMADAFRMLEFPDADTFGRQYWGLAEFSSDDWALALSLIDGIKREMSALNARARSSRYAAPLSERLIRLHTAELLALFSKSRAATELAQWKEPARQHTVHTGMYQKVHEIAAWLQSNSSETISLDALAEQFCISKSYLTRIFKAVTGFTVTEYQTFSRIKKAQLLLKETELNITEIAAQTGFGNITYFERVFRRATAKTPLQYRKAGRG